MATKTQKTMFKVGDRLVCVDDSPAYETNDRCPLKIGVEYTCEGASPFSANLVLIEGVDWPNDPLYSGFHVRRFRKAQDQSITAKLVEQFKEGYVEERPEHVPQTQEA